MVAFGLTACIDDSVAQRRSDNAVKPRVLGFVELTFSGIGTPEFALAQDPAPTLEHLSSATSSAGR